MAKADTPDVPSNSVPPVEPAPTAKAATKPIAKPAAAPAAAPVNPYAPVAPAATMPPQPYANGPYVPSPPRGLSITSMALGIAGIVLGLGFPVGIGAVITGHMASKSQPYARTFWLTGIITGYVGLGISILVGIFIVLMFVISLAAVGGSMMYGY